ncbi:MAG: hypothetical protein WC942_11070, partial [Clostridia bacterium]
MSTTISTIYDLWNIRNNLTEDYIQINDINLIISNPTAGVYYWSENLQYEKNILINYEETIYFSIGTPILGLNPISDSDNWCVFNYHTLFEYKPGAIVLDYDGYLYYCYGTPTLGLNPYDDPGNWGKMWAYAYGWDAI